MSQPASLEFAGEGAPAQTVTVVAQGGLTWTAEPEEAIAGWVTLAVEGDKITVTAADNPETASRSGNIVVTPSVESVGQKAIRVVQTGKEVIPELSATPTELPLRRRDQRIYRTADHSSDGRRYHVASHVEY